MSYGVCFFTSPSSHVHSSSCLSTSFISDRQYQRRAQGAKYFRTANKSAYTYKQSLGYQQYNINQIMIKIQTHSTALPVSCDQTLGKWNVLFNLSLKPCPQFFLPVDIIHICTTGPDSSPRAKELRVQKRRMHTDADTVSIESCERAAGNLEGPYLSVELGPFGRRSSVKGSESAQADRIKKQLPRQCRT